ncbi:DUF4382 domain-containing protein [Pedobacter puniceum]|uniref:DUF4382 domain-containing protein n=1 Tax=Pedobacter puniceum TaxID=2666136 RepID=A0A7K0FKH2_9SPHI|nr:DUF4382 domain-containing protein [Pedobacter puniceum]MRX46131.1 DUF4382 domain-containing protein [Pedobacter puniceum]
MKKKFTYAVLGLVASLGLFSACQKDEIADGKSKVEIRMTDAPGSFDAINLDVKEIVLLSGDETYVFPVTTNIFNILDFRIGTSNPDILVASGEMPAGEITEIRLVLDEGNTIVVDGEELPLQTPSGQSSGFKVKLTENPELLSGAAYTLLLDFDAAKSIVKTGNNKYILKPVVRGITAATTGLISGTVLPLESAPEVLVISGTDTVGTVPNAETGAFIVGGLKTGTYAVKFVPVAGFKDSTITNVSVTAGQIKSLGTITLKP